MSDLFDSSDERDDERLRAAGWTPTVYAGGTAWVSPGKRVLCTREEALKKLERQQKEKKDNGS